MASLQPTCRGRNRYVRPTRALKLEALEDRSLPSTVTNLADSGPGSLRAAIAETPAGGTVDFQPGLGGVITLNSVLGIPKKVRIIGPGPTFLTISGNDATQIFNVSATGDLSVEHLTLAHGRVVGGGGAIYTAGGLGLVDVVVRDSTASAGGAIYIDVGGGGGVYVSTITNNHALSGDSGGGGIYNAGQFFLYGEVSHNTVGASQFGGRGGGVTNAGNLSVWRSTIRDNVVAAGNNGGAGGGGIYNTGWLGLSQTTISGNIIDSSTSGDGGGIRNGLTGTLDIVNSTFSGNRVGGQGGGIYNAQFGGVTIASATFSQNVAGEGGGLALVADSAATVRNTLIAGNTATAGPDILGHVPTAEYNLVGNGAGSSGLIHGSDGNQVGTPDNPINPDLSPLRHNGGPSFTHALMPGSPAIDAGNNDFFTGHDKFDQRVSYRFAHGTIDIGAYEFAGPAGEPNIFALGAAPGRVELRWPSNGDLSTTFAPYGTSYSGGVAVAVADVDADGASDLITAATSGNPHVKVFSGAAMLLPDFFDRINQDTAALTSFMAFGVNFNVGANVAAGDVDNDGFADIVIGASAGNPHVKVFSGQDIARGQFDLGGSLMAEWFPYAVQFNVGTHLAVGHINRDAYADIVTGATIGNPHVKVYDGRDIAQGNFLPESTSLIASWFAYGLNFNVGAFVSVGDTNRDGFGDVITGASLGNPHVRVYDGQAIANGTFDPDGSVLAEFFAFELSTGTGVSVGFTSTWIGNENHPGILTGALKGAPRYKLVATDSAGINPPALNGIEGVPETFGAGVYVGG
jgi:hypothetical protein